MLDDHHVDVAALVVDALDQPVVAAAKPGSLTGRG
jgi:hypothetical protein